MAISTKQLQNMIYDPARMQSAILAYIESDDANRGIVDATNPATMLLESAVATASASASETYRSIRMKYPDLAARHPLRRRLNLSSPLGKSPAVFHALLYRFALFSSLF